MSRVLPIGLFLLLTAGCRISERLPPPLLPEDSQPLPYTDLVSRARQQASAANEAFYLNRWVDLERSADGLEQTARFLPKATDVPARHRTSLPAEAADLGKDAVKLRDAAKTSNVNLTNQVLQRINLKVRELRMESRYP